MSTLSEWLSGNNCYYAMQIWKNVCNEFPRNLGYHAPLKRETLFHLIVETENKLSYLITVDFDVLAVHKAETTKW